MTPTVGRFLRAALVICAGSFASVSHAAPMYPAPFLIPEPNQIHGDMVVGHLDDDGLADIVVAGAYGGQPGSVWRGNGDGTFTYIQAVPYTGIKTSIGLGARRDSWFAGTRIRLGPATRSSCRWLRTNTPPFASTT